MVKSKLSVMQLMLLMYLTIITTAILVVPANTSIVARTDMWFTPLWSLPVGLLAFWVAYRLHQYYPGDTPIQYFPKLLGKIPGKALGFLYVLLHIFMAALVLREYSEFIMGPFLDQTPILAVMGSVLAVCAYAVHKGIEVLARISVLFVMPFMALIVFTMVLLYPVLEPRNALPFLEFGIVPSLKGSYVAQGWMSEFSLVAYFMPFLPVGAKPVKAMTRAVLLVIATLVTVNSTALLLFGILTQNLSYPFLVAVRFISYANFFEHLEAAAMVIWVATLIVKLSVFYYISVSNIAQWIQMPDYRPLVVPIGGIILVTGVVMVPNQETLSLFLNMAAPALFLLFLLIIPLLLWALASIRFRHSSKGATAS
ncbi:GerAB/ArcD/ProY family transporter [Gorillibacterium timonense]|uniref:GerAB/ArcD/ProY family transporter n=1 Tax=Gorillibacterium timonense TaxID=1689269 RepID=UPI00071E1F55|nr:endospore germination permease [Gorillibacterium timonense]